MLHKRPADCRQQLQAVWWMRYVTQHSSKVLFPLRCVRSWRNGQTSNVMGSDALQRCGVPTAQPWGRRNWAPWRGWSIRYWWWVLEEVRRGIEQHRVFSDCPFSFLGRFLSEWSDPEVSEFQPQLQLFNSPNPKERRFTAASFRKGCTKIHPLGKETRWCHPARDENTC